MRKLALTVAVATTVASCEIAARALLDLRGFRSRHDERAAFLGRLPLHDAAGNESRDADASAVERVSGAAFVLQS